MKAILFVPFWGQVGHVGCNRIDRFVRWLFEEGYFIVIIRAGSVDGERSQFWGQEITVHDRMGLHPEAVIGTAYAVSPRKPNKYRRALANWLFSPDPAIVWARTAAKHPSVLQAMNDATFILSSSPPESAHVGAHLLSTRTGVPHIVDMRDGWLDEPLKPLLRSSLLRRWQEGRMEAQILNDAKAVQVTSDDWQKLLCQRFPELRYKVHVLTNGYPQHLTEPMPLRKTKKNDEEFVLIHAGRFLGSRLTQSPDILLAPLLQSLSLHPDPVKGVICLIGPLSDLELQLIEPFKRRFKKIGWDIEWLRAMPREQLLKFFPQVDGLLLLSASYAAIPSKLFEYIPTTRPIFVVTMKEGATWRVCEELPQAVLVEIKQNVISIDFIKKIKEAGCRSLVPDNYTEGWLKAIFLTVVTQVLKK